MPHDEEELISQQGNGAIYISLMRRRIPAIDDEERYISFVRVATKDDQVEEEFPDPFQAQAFYRRICADHGLSVPYQAPAFSLDNLVPGERTAVDLLHTFRSELARHGAGSDAALAIRDRMLEDPDIERVAGDLMNLAGGNDWIAATIRTVCRRVQVRVEKRNQEERARQMAEIEGFGEF